MSNAPSAGGYGRQTGNAADTIVDQAGKYAAAASDQIDKVVQGTESAARSVAAHGRDAGERVQQVAGNFQTAIDKSVREQPLTTLAVAAALGFVLGALWKS